MQHLLSKTENNKTISVRNGDTIVIELEETPTSGYMWQLAESPDNLELQSNSFQLTSSAMGGGGQRRIVFSINGAINNSIHLKKQREWSGDVVETFIVNLQSA